MRDLTKRLRSNIFAQRVLAANAAADRIDMLENYQKQSADDLVAYSSRIDELVAENKRLLVLATKWCDTKHHDWEEILHISKDRDGR